MGIEFYFIIAVLIVGFYMLWNIGANDVANAIGTSVGSGALTLKKAILIAAIFEFSGSILFGGHVSHTIQSGLIDPNDFASEPMSLVVGMLASLLATSFCLQIATLKGWPVSTTHAIVGSILGFGLIAGGAEAIQWKVILSVVCSWVISPVFSAFLAFIFFRLVQKRVLFAKFPILATKRTIPLLVFIVIFTFAMSLSVSIATRFYIYLICFSIALLGSLISYILLKFAHYPATYVDGETSAVDQQIDNLNLAVKNLEFARLFAQESESSEIHKLLKETKALTREVRKKASVRRPFSKDFTLVEKMMGYLQILTASFVSFAHGANDVANAVGPIAAILSILKDPKSIAHMTKIPYWILIFGGAGIVMGLATYGWKVIETIGRKITELTPTRGFCAEFGAAATILIATKFGIPISTTHCLVGAVLGVGMARGLAAINLSMIKEIGFSWLITVPTSALLSMLLFSLFDFTLKYFSIL